MKHNVPTTLRRNPYVPGCQNSAWRLLNAAELCQMIRAESDDPSTFHRTSDITPRLEQVTDASFVAL